MKLDFLQEEPKLILTYPHKSKFNVICPVFIISSAVIVILILNYLSSCGNDFADNLIIVMVLIYAPILIFSLGYYLFINGVKLEIYENNVVKYYTYGNRGHSILHFKCELKDIEQIKIKNRPFNCCKLTVSIRNPVFYGWNEKKLKKLRKVIVITDRKKSGIFIQELEKFQ